MKKRGQTHQVFTYIMTLFIVGLILLVGVWAIQQFIERSEEIEHVTLKNTLEREIKTIRSNYGTTKFVDIPISKDLKSICFIDSLELENAAGTRPLIGYVNTSRPPSSLDAVVESDVQTIFESGKPEEAARFYPIGVFDLAIDVGRISVRAADSTQQVICFNKLTGLLEMELTGLGDSTQIAHAPPPPSP